MRRCTYVECSGGDGTKCIHSICLHRQRRGCGRVKGACVTLDAGAVSSAVVPYTCERCGVSALLGVCSCGGTAGTSIGIDGATILAAALSRAVGLTDLDVDSTCAVGLGLQASRLQGSKCCIRILSRYGARTGGCDRHSASPANVLSTATGPRQYGSRVRVGGCARPCRSR